MTWESVLAAIFAYLLCILLAIWSSERGNKVVDSSDFMLKSVRALMLMMIISYASKGLKWEDDKIVASVVLVSSISLLVFYSSEVYGAFLTMRSGAKPKVSTDEPSDEECMGRIISKKYHVIPHYGMVRVVMVTSNRVIFECGGKLTEVGLKKFYKGVQECDKIHSRGVR